MIPPCPVPGCPPGLTALDSFDVDIGLPMREAFTVLKESEQFRNKPSLGGGESGSEDAEERPLFSPCKHQIITFDQRPQNPDELLKFAKYARPNVYVMNPDIDSETTQEFVQMIQKIMLDPQDQDYQISQVMLKFTYYCQKYQSLEEYISLNLAQNFLLNSNWNDEFEKKKQEVGAVEKVLDMEHAYSDNEDESEFGRSSNTLKDTMPDIPLVIATECARVRRKCQALQGVDYYESQWSANGGDSQFTGSFVTYCDFCDDIERRKKQLQERKRAAQVQAQLSSSSGSNNDDTSSSSSDDDDTGGVPPNPERSSSSGSDYATPSSESDSSSFAPPQNPVVPSQQNSDDEVNKRTQIAEKIKRDFRLLINIESNIFDKNLSTLNDHLITIKDAIPLSMENLRKEIETLASYFNKIKLRDSVDQLEKKYQQVKSNLEKAIRDKQNENKQLPQKPDSNKQEQIKQKQIEKERVEQQEIQRILKIIRDTDKEVNQIFLDLRNKQDLNQFEDDSDFQKMEKSFRHCSGKIEEIKEELKKADFNTVGLEIEFDELKNDYEKRLQTFRQLQTDWENEAKKANEKAENTERREKNQTTKNQQDTEQKASFEKVIKTFEPPKYAAWHINLYPTNSQFPWQQVQIWPKFSSKPGGEFSTSTGYDYLEKILDNRVEFSAGGMPSGETFWPQMKSITGDAFLYSLFKELVTNFRIGYDGIELRPIKSNMMSPDRTMYFVLSVNNNPIEWPDSNDGMSHFYGQKAHNKKISAPLSQIGPGTYIDLNIRLEVHLPEYDPGQLKTIFRFYLFEKT